nr:hypothetical protein [Pedobacter psychrodurus]
MIRIREEIKNPVRLVLLKKSRTEIAVSIGGRDQISSTFNHPANGLAIISFAYPLKSANLLKVV